MVWIVFIPETPWIVDSDFELFDIQGISGKAGGNADSSGSSATPRSSAPKKKFGDGLRISAEEVVEKMMTSSGNDGEEGAEREHPVWKHLLEIALPQYFTEDNDGWYTLNLSQIISICPQISGKISFLIQEDAEWGIFSPKHVFILKDREEAVFDPRKRPLISLRARELKAAGEVPSHEDTKVAPLHNVPSGDDGIIKEAGHDRDPNIILSEDLESLVNPEEFEAFAWKQGFPGLASYLSVFGQQDSAAPPEIGHVAPQPEQQYLPSIPEENELEQNQADSFMALDSRMISRLNPLCQGLGFL
ncbi:hypothetical protein TSTA_077460 [Talaromyces stipitatus ATCC 10500]|uniref:Uncharacterized protein n=1 Tax=Talaromyces stipitatus (strain ATCC 10500 / CBS 375.48 / QM 6759 / NRRL 1006) TaxID=441959 RepID=B8LW18_TALSN|nr:uncharacterized protein TSTA_077460 [Talaromyces stipitatus ATCC 10500]EED24384.1 hypothetical protein TSTA_077460 [Talaromyces stipitatus ATCC 10500]